MKFKELKLLSKDTLIYGVGNASNRLIQLFLAPLYAAVLAADRFGIRSLTIALFGVLRIVITLALEQAVLADYYQVKTDEDRHKVVSTGFTFTLITSLVTGAAIFALARPLALLIGLGPVEGVVILRLFAIYTTFTPSSFIYLTFLRSEKRPTTYMLFTIITSALRVGLIFLFLTVLGRELQGLYEADAITSVVIFPFLLVSIYLYSKGIKFSFKHLRSMFTYSLPMIPSIAFVWLRNLGDRFFINLYLDKTELGIYSFALYFPNVITFLLITPLSLSWAPYSFSIKDRKEFPHTIARVFTYLLLISGWALLVLGSNASEILRLVAKNPEYWEGAPLVPLLILGVCFYGAASVIGAGIAVKRKTVFFTLTTFVAGALAVVVNVTLLPVIGIWAAALASVISYIGMFVATALLVNRLVKIPYEVKRIFLIAAVAITLTALCSLWHPHSLWLGFLVKAGGGSILYFSFLYLMGFLLPEEKSFLKSLPARIRKRWERRKNKKSTEVSD